MGSQQPLRVAGAQRCCAGNREASPGLCSRHCEALGGAGPSLCKVIPVVGTMQYVQRRICFENKCHCSGNCRAQDMVMQGSRHVCWQGTFPASAAGTNAGCELSAGRRRRNSGVLAVLQALAVVCPLRECRPVSSEQGAGPCPTQVGGSLGPACPAGGTAGQANQRRLQLWQAVGTQPPCYHCIGC